MGALPSPVGTVACEPGENVRYICPQTISLGGGDGEVTLYFRVLAPEIGARVKASVGGKALESRKTIKVNPGEMEHVTVKLADLVGDTVRIDAVKEG